MSATGGPSAPQARSGPPLWVWIIAGIILALGLIALSLGKAIGRAMRVGALEKPTRPLVVEGRPLVWNEIDRFDGSSAGYGGRLLIADFTGDKQDDVLVLFDTGRLKLYPTGGTPSEPKARVPVSLDCVAWDCDRDGIADLVLPGAPTREVRSLDGTRLATLPTSAPVYTGDLDGDGRKELVHVDVPPRHVVRGRDAEIAWDLDIPDGIAAIGNGNADKRDEMMSYSAPDEDTDWGVFTIYQRDKATQSKGWRPMFPRQFIDVTGDRRADVVDAMIGYIDGSYGEFMAMPEARELFPAALELKAAGGKFLESNRAQIAVIAYGPTRGTQVTLFAPQGRMIYHEQMGDYVADVGSFNDGHHDRLVLLLNQRLITYP